MIFMEDLWLRLEEKTKNSGERSFGDQWVVSIDFGQNRRSIDAVTIPAAKDYAILI